MEVENPEVDAFVLDRKEIWIRTPVQPHETNHTFNGIMGNLQSITKYPTLEILGFMVAGVLGPTKVLVCENSWKAEENLKNTGPNPQAWTEIYSADLVGSRDLRKCTFIQLPQPIVLLPQQVKGFYIHCQTNHDESLAYHSHFSSEESTLCEDGLISISTGLAKVGPTPFGPSPFGRNGWRDRRAFCGSIVYRPKKMQWSAETHDSFPVNFQNVVSFLFVEWEKEGSIFNILACEDLSAIVEYFDWDWFEGPEAEENNEERQKLFNKIREKMLRLQWHDMY